MHKSTPGNMNKCVKNEYNQIQAHNFLRVCRIVSTIPVEAGASYHEAEWLAASDSGHNIDAEPQRQRPCRPQPSTTFAQTTAHARIARTAIESIIQVPKTIKLFRSSEYKAA